MNYTQKLAKAKARELAKKEASLFTYKWVLIDDGNCEICPIQSVEARYLGHALQKIAGSLPTNESEASRIEIWR